MGFEFRQGRNRIQIQTLSSCETLGKQWKLPKPCYLSYEAKLSQYLPLGDVERGENTTPSALVDAWDTEGLDKGLFYPSPAVGLGTWGRPGPPPALSKSTK